MGFRESLEHGHFTMDELKHAHQTKGCRLVDAEDIIREASRQECMNATDPDIEDLFYS